MSTSMKRNIPWNIIDNVKGLTNQLIRCSYLGKCFHRMDRHDVTKLLCFELLTSSYYKVPIQNLDELWIFTITIEFTRGSADIKGAAVVNVPNNPI